MSRGLNNKPSSDWIQRELEALRSALHNTGQWPEAADQLLYHLAQSDQNTSLREEDEWMLSLVVNDVLKGVDIAQQYPEFYKKLLANVELRQAFLDTLELLEMERTDTLQPLPQEASRDLAFLHNTADSPTIKGNTWHNLRLVWHKMVADLQELLASPQTTPAFRDGDSLLADPWLPLLHSELHVEDARLRVSLEATWPVEQPDVLKVLLSAAVSDSDVDLSSLRASLQWGAYHESADLSPHGLATFPPLPRHLIFDEESQAITADLRLTLNARHG